jgi:hypothetical protein
MRSPEKETERSKINAGTLMALDINDPQQIHGAVEKVTLEIFQFCKFAREHGGGLYQRILRR